MSEPQSLQELFEEYQAANRPKVPTYVWDHYSSTGMILKTSDTFDSRDDCRQDALVNAHCEGSDPFAVEDSCKSNHWTRIMRVI